jgi:DNA-directed RNA polymerase subunit RPC12/RpoP
VDNAVRKFPCPRCGAAVVWHPGEAKLSCAYCGTSSDVADVADVAAALADATSSEHPANGVVAERSLEEELARPHRVGWGTERKAYRCARCGAVETMDPGLSASKCAFCGTAAVSEAPADETLARPEGVLPFRIERRDAIGRFRGWLSRLWFRPNDLRRIANLESIQGVYIPFWTFDAATVSHWTAEAGYHKGSGKNRRTVWRPASGVVHHDFDDLPVPASKGIEPNLARLLEPFPTAELKPYEPSYLAGFLAEQYGVDLKTAWATGKARMDATLVEACRRDVPGDTCRNLQVRSSYSNLGVKSGLLPIWIAAYTYRGRSFRYVVNGATGAAAGTAPWSWVKLTLAGMGILAIVVFVLANS